jgi:hypothetical protein
MKHTLLVALVALVWAACSDNAPTDAPAPPPPPPPSAVHDTIAMDSPPAAVGTLPSDFACKLSMFGVSTSVTVTNAGVRTGVDNHVTASTVRVGDSSRVWFVAEDVPFSPITLRFNGTLAGDSIVGWGRTTDRRDGAYKHRAMTLRRLF